MITKFLRIPLISKSIFRSVGLLSTVQVSYSTTNVSNLFEIKNKKTSLELKVVRTADKASKTFEFNPHWLRFNCHSNLSKQPNTGQRTIDVNCIPDELLIESCHLIDNFVHIKWNEVSKQHETIIPVDFLINNYPVVDKVDSNVENARYKTPKELEFFDYNNFFDKNGQKNHQELHKWIKSLAVYGVNIVKNVPAVENQVKELAKLIAPVQNTIYGEIFDVKVENNPINIAYSNVPLIFHMDLMYYESSPGLQFLHCIKFDDCIKGGESEFLDVFHVAEQFRKEYPTLFHHLTQIPATFQKFHIQRARPVLMTYRRPHIVLNNRQEIITVNWSPPFEGPLSDLTKEEIANYYESYLKFSKFINNNENAIVYKLKEGETACFNNRRILHARKGFELFGGMRHFQGCYVNIDEFKSEALVSEYFNLAKQNFDPIDPSQLELKKIIYGNGDFN